MFSLLLAVPASAQNDNQGPARHDLLALTPSSRDSKTGELLDLTAWSLLQYNPDQIKEFTEQLCTRVNWDIKVVYEDGSYEYWYTLDLFRIYRITIRPNAIATIDEV